MLRRIGLTQIAYVSQVDSAGVIFIRYPGSARRGLGRSIVQLVEEQGAKLIGSFVVVQPGQIRFSAQHPSKRE